MLLALFFASASAGPNLDAIVKDDGTYDVLVNGVVWLPGGATKVWGGGKEYSSEAGAANPLKVAGTPSRFSGTDAMGAFDATELKWLASGAAATTVGLITQVKVYEKHIIFEQRAPFPLKPGRNPAASSNTAYPTPKPTGAPESVSTVFPSFEITDLSNATKAAPRRGALAYDGDMVGSDFKHFEWKKGTPLVPGGVKGTAPIVIFTEDLSTTTVISPAYNMMATNQEYDAKTGFLSYGVFGNADVIPPGFIVQTVVQLSR